MLPLLMVLLLVALRPGQTLRVAEVYNFRTFNFSLPDPAGNQILYDGSRTTSAATPITLTSPTLIKTGLSAAAAPMTDPLVADIAGSRVLPVTLAPADMPEPYSEKGLHLELLPMESSPTLHTPPLMSSSQPQPQSQVDVFSAKPSGTYCVHRFIPPPPVI